jgi:chaperonin cofactor prefoldin
VSLPFLHPIPSSLFQRAHTSSLAGRINTNYPSYKIGDSFFQLPLEDAQSMLTTSTEQIDTEVSKLEDSMGEVREEMQQLKVALYARFGRSINLET